MFLLKESRSFFRQGWTIAVLLIALLVSLPILSVASSLLTNSSQVWQHLLETVLWDYLVNS
jgi:iron(III) transport system permease protein